MIKKEKVEFVAANARLVEEQEKLKEALKALEVTHSLLVKSHEQLQTQCYKCVSPSTSIVSCDHANIIEKNAMLKAELAKVTSAKTSTPKGKEKVAAQVLELKPHKGKEGLGYVAKAKKKVDNTKKNRTKPTQTNISTACVMLLGARPIVVTLQGIKTPTTFFRLIIMGMCMLNMLVLRTVSLLILFGFQRHLLLMKEDPLRNGYLNRSNDLL